MVLYVRDEKKREPGLDLLRCLAFLFVVIFHAFLFNGFYHLPQTGLWIWLADSLRWLSVSCIGLFLMLTGYLKSSPANMSALSPPCAYYRGLGRILLGYLLASAVSIPVRHFLLGDIQSLTVWINRLFGFGGVYYGWYVEMYICLILISPILNAALERVDNTRSGSLLWPTASLLFITALPGATSLNLLPDVWRSFYPLTYYWLGALVRRTQPKIKTLPALLAAAGFALSLGGVTVLSTDGPLASAFTQEFGDIWIVPIVFCLFIGLYHVQTNRHMAGLLRLAADGCFGGYLLSHLFDASCYPAGWPVWQSLLCVTLPIFFLSLLCGILLEKAVSLLLRRKNNISKKPGKPPNIPFFK